MTDRRRRPALATPTGIPAGIPTGTAPVLLRQRWSLSGPSRSTDRASRGPADDNPFAAPPEGRPEQPWRPRGRRGSDPSGEPGGPEGNGGDGGRDGDRPEDSSPDWGGRWSSRQPRRQGGGFGGGFGGGGRPEGSGRDGGAPGGMRWDPTDPVQRQARYALLSGMWGFFFALFGLPWLATPLGALAVYWGIGSIRAKPGAGGARGTGAGTGAGTADGTRAAARPEDVAGTDRAPAGAAEPAGATPHPAAGQGARPQFAAAVSGLVAGIIALLIIAAQFSVQLVYRDYFVCVEDALTNSSREACERHLPEELRPLFGERDQ
ncbi:hypothetical protein [Streptomyces sp. DH37]|uniref:hypothetical protein n=1 Tax=Streptomyces sp. DH37 TaxID=3040122 RepID=UPI0024435D4F|nr:hypothetical protein [Streptomyces sp. DH37]MDG9704293.1 hypothetical protein [Streptomyces sp. DH37]